MWLNRKEYETLITKAASLAGEALSFEKRELMFVDKIGSLIAANKDLSHRIAVVEAKNLKLQDMLSTRVPQGSDPHALTIPLDGMFDEAPEDVERTIKEMEQLGEMYLVKEGSGDG